MEKRNTKFVGIGGAALKQPVVSLNSFAPAPVDHCHGHAGFEGLLADRELQIAGDIGRGTSYTERFTCLPTRVSQR